MGGFALKNPTWGRAAAVFTPALVFAAAWAISGSLLKAEETHRDDGLGYTKAESWLVNAFQLPALTKLVG